eukprot:sb/3461369/
MLSHRDQESCLSSLTLGKAISSHSLARLKTLALDRILTLKVRVVRRVFSQNLVDERGVPPGPLERYRKFPISFISYDSKFLKVEIMNIYYVITNERDRIGNFRYRSSGPGGTPRSSTKFCEKTRRTTLTLMINGEKERDKSYSENPVPDKERGKQTPNEFLKQLIGRPVVVKLSSGVDYRGIFANLDGYMNVILEQTEEYMNGELKNKGVRDCRGPRLGYMFVCRVPALSWLHPKNEASITRCSQPCVGIRKHRCEEDETMIAEIRKATTVSTHIHICDCRPAMNAKANMAKGCGYETPRNYENIEFSFGNYIHAMRDSNNKLRALVTQPEIDETKWFSNLAATQWLSYVQSVLNEAVRVASTIENKRSSVVIHCSDGWDRTSQISSLSMILLDPYYRTLQGFEVLIEKEWLSFGHMFRTRTCHGSKTMTGKIARPRFWGFQIVNIFISDNYSPIFLQFIDCVWQIGQLYPHSFEFNNNLLLTIAQHLHSCLFGTFLFDCDKQRKEMEVKTKTVSLWSYINTCKTRFLNPLYKEKKECILPVISMRTIRLWKQYWMAYHPYHNIYVNLRKVHFLTLGPPPLALIQSLFPFLKLNPCSARCEEDETMIAEIRKATTVSTHIHICDCRPAMNAKANMAKGCGYETPRNYENIEFSFGNIENIHAMRDSNNKLRALVTQPEIDETKWFSNLAATQWLSYVQSVLNEAVRVASTIENKRSSVVIHCSDGWDRTSQISSLSMILLDPYYRTLQGFEVLIEKEWLSFGHMFRTRTCHGSKTMTGNVRPQFWGFQIVNIFISDNYSPIFLQFIDCVWQIGQLYPHSFEFNNNLLLTIAQHLHSCLFGTFLFDCDKQRKEMEVKTKTVSLWSYINTCKTRFLNPLYKEKKECILPVISMRTIRLWKQYWMAYHPYHKFEDPTFDRTMELVGLREKIVGESEEARLKNQAANKNNVEKFSISKNKAFPFETGVLVMIEAEVPYISPFRRRQTPFCCSQICQGKISKRSLANSSLWCRRPKQSADRLGSTQIRSVKHGVIICLALFDPPSPRPGLNKTSHRLSVSVGSAAPGSDSVSVTAWCCRPHLRTKWGMAPPYRAVMGQCSDLSSRARIGSML